MSPERRTEFYSWYEKEKTLGKTFNLQDELLAYCVSDVDILRRCCVQFRYLFQKVTSTGLSDKGVDPFQNCITIASACNLVFRRNFLTPKTIAVLPPNGYNCTDKQSAAALRWLKYVDYTEGIHIQHAQNSGEKRIGKYKVDGFSEKEKTLYEFHGCFYHGCPRCYPNRGIINPINNTPMIELYARTIQKEMFLKSYMNYYYVEMWECRFNNIWNNLPCTMREKINQTMPKPVINLNPRDAFYGGRTNATCLFYEVAEGEQIHYVDFCSLYPYTNKYCSYPVGHPKV